MRNDKARHTEGSGLGLYIAKSIIELMGGKLDIRVIGDLFRVEVVLAGWAHDDEAPPRPRGAQDEPYDDN